MTRVPQWVPWLLPYASVSLYYAMVFATYGLHGGDLEDCSASVAPHHPTGQSGACPYFAGPLHHNPWNAAVLGYRTWTSRFAVELIAYALSHALWLFVLITLALSWLFVWSARNLLEIRSAPGLTAFAGLFFLVVPFQFHASAGVYSTVIVGSWTAFLGLFAVAIVARLIRRQPTSRALVWATIPALLVALCSEQFVVVFGFAGGALAYQAIVRRRRDLRAALVLYGALWAAGVLNILLAPGNRAREAAEIDRWRPEFAETSLVEKLADGVHHALFLLAGPDPSTLDLAAVLAVSLIVAAHHRAEVSYLPGLAVLGWLAALTVVSALGVDLSRHASTTVVTVAALAAAAVWGGAQVTEPHPSDRIVVGVLLAAGFGSALLLSFSPTVWASDTRTLLLEYLALVGALFLVARAAWRCWLRRPRQARAPARRGARPPTGADRTPEG